MTHKFLPPVDEEDKNKTVQVVYSTDSQEREIMNRTDYTSEVSNIRSLSASSSDNDAKKKKIRTKKYEDESESEKKNKKSKKEKKKNKK